ncbi:MAG: hypothetical protein FJ280_19185 [Planctomycetes bacterium]|nr:hypothetical protein [Planctomycetota bacterium]
MENRHLTDRQELLAELAREGSEARRETSTVVAPGARIPARVVKVKSHVAYNVYRVRAVVINSPGLAPTEIGEQMDAINLAESFLAPGTLAPGVYTIITRVGEKNVFYAVP